MKKPVAIAMTAASVLGLAGCGAIRGGIGKETGGTIIGGIAGGALGSRIGKGRGRTVATIAGAIIGGLVGSSIGPHAKEILECALMKADL